MMFVLLAVKSQFSCGTPTSGIPKDFVLDDSKHLNNTICVNVQFHIVRDDNGSSDVTDTTIDKLVGILNNDFNPHNIHINKSGINYINNTLYYNMNDDNLFYSLIQINNNPNAINFYIINSTNSWGGKAGDITSKNLVMTRPYLLSSVSSHEVGHCLNLWHTFQGTKPGTRGCPENINGSNCLSCGDYVCDTPADKGIGFENGYRPDMYNIMSYYTLNHFTNQQGERMRNALRYSPILQSVVSKSCNSIIGPYSICENVTINYTLDNNLGLNVTWSVSSNLSIQSSTQNGISIISSSGGKGYITASFEGGLSVTKNIWIGVPIIEDSISPDTSPTNSTLCKSYTYNTTNVITAMANGVYNNPTWEWEKASSNFYWHNNNNKAYLLPYQTGIISFKVRVNNDCGKSNWKLYVISVIDCNDNPDLFKIYPNPSSDIVNVGLKGLNYKLKSEIQIELFDINGLQILKNKTDNDKLEFRVNNLKKGVYQLRIYYDNKYETHQLIIK